MQFLTVLFENYSQRIKINSSHLKKSLLEKAILKKETGPPPKKKQNKTKQTKGR